MKKKVVSMHVFAAFLAAGMLCLSAPAGLASDRSYTREDLDQAISQIRSWFYNPTPEVEQVAVPGGEDGWEYDSEYYFYDGDLFFAYLTLDGEEQRFYYDEDRLIRYIDEDGQVYDYGNLEDYEIWGMRVLTQGYSYMGGQPGGADPEEIGGGADPEGDEDPEEYWTAEDCAGYFRDDLTGLSILTTAILSQDSLLVTRLTADGDLLEETRMGWRMSPQEFWFVAGEGEEHTYASLMYSEVEPFVELNIHDEYSHYYPVEIYGPAELEFLARQYYEYHHGGISPEFVAAEGVDEEGRVMIRFYDEVMEVDGTGHTSTADWYYVDPETLDTEDFLGNFFVLNVLDFEEME